MSVRPDRPDRPGRLEPQWPPVQVAPADAQPSHSPRSNQLLAAWPVDKLARWRHDLEAVELLPGQVLHEANVALSHVYFPCSAIVSLLYEGANGDSTEIAVVGNEGVVGIAVFLGGGSTANRAVVRSAGTAYRLRAAVLRAAFHRSAPVMQLLLRYTQVLITQMAQAVVCNRHHTLDQQLCRWLLMSLDRLHGDEMTMTHELIASLLGVRREGVTEAALKLQRAGLIRYARGHIQVLDRPGLAQRSCECYAVVRAESERLLPTSRGPQGPAI